MSVYKQFKSSDYIVTPFKVNKSFTFKGANEFTSSNVGIDRFLGKNTPSSLSYWVSGSDPTGQITTYNQKLIYDSIKQLYYSNYLSSSYGDIATTSSIRLGSNPTGNVLYGPLSSQGKYFNYYSNITSLTFPRVFPTASNDEIGVISIPSNLFGECIKPGTFSFSYSGSATTGVITDDEEGNLFNDGYKVGDIIYQHGMVILTAYGSSITGSVYGGASYGTGIYGTSTTVELGDVLNSNNVTCSFQSTTTIYESQYKCTLRENEFTHTLNPSATSSSLNNNILYNSLTGSYFEPYITTVGLYNNNYELIAVGKLSQPLQSSNTTDTSILVNLDL